MNRNRSGFQSEVAVARGPAMSRSDDSDGQPFGDGPLLLKAKEVAKMLGLGRTKVYEMMDSGELPVVRIGTAVRVPRKALLDWIGENTQRAA